MTSAAHNLALSLERWKRWCAAKMAFSGRVITGLSHRRNAIGLSKPRRIRSKLVAQYLTGAHGSREPATIIQLGNAARWI